MNPVEVTMAAQALHAMSMYKNAYLVTGRCVCTPECVNHRATVWRLDDSEDVHEAMVGAQPAATGVGANVWEALCACFVDLTEAVAAAESRDDEIEELNRMWNAE